MSDESISAIQAATMLGGESLYIDRRSQIDLGNLKDVIVIVKGSVVLLLVVLRKTSSQNWRRLARRCAGWSCFRSGNGSSHGNRGDSNSVV